LSRKNTISTAIKIVFISLTLLIIGGITWGNIQFSKNNAIAKDFFVPWLSARTFLEYGDSPYSNPATQRNQILFYGQLARGSIDDPLILWVALPGELFFFPFALIRDYDLARGIWMTINEIALLFATILSIKLFKTAPNRLLMTAMLLFAMLWIFGALNLISNSPAPFVLLATLGSLYAIGKQRDDIAGVLLVFPVLSLRIYGIFLLFILWWTLYHRRWRVIAGLGMSIGILLLLSFLLLPDWIFPFLRGIYWHLKFNPGISTYQILKSSWPVIGPRLGWLVTAFLSLLLFVEWRGTRHSNHDHFLWAACLTLSVTPLLGFQVNAINLVILCVPTFLLITIIKERWSTGRNQIPAILLLIFIWVSSWVLVIFLNPWMSLVIPIFLVSGLMYMKWWIVNPPRTLFENWK